MTIDARQLLRIIKVCKNSGVSEIKLGELEIKFGPGEAAQTLVVAGETGPTPTDKELRDVEERVENERMFDYADEELAFMQVEDPALFEELLVNRELESSGERKEELFDRGT